MNDNYDLADAEMGEEPEYGRSAGDLYTKVATGMMAVGAFFATACGEIDRTPEEHLRKTEDVEKVYNEKLEDIAFGKLGNNEIVAVYRAPDAPAGARMGKQYASPVDIGWADINDDGETDVFINRESSGDVYLEAKEGGFEEIYGVDLSDEVSPFYDLVEE